MVKDVRNNESKDLITTINENLLRTDFMDQSRSFFANNMFKKVMSKNCFCFEQDRIFGTPFII